MAAAVNLQGLRALVQQGLTAALDELFGNLQKTFAEYEQEIRRQRKLLDLLTENRALNPAERSDSSLHLLPENRALNLAERSDSSLHLLPENRALNPAGRRVPSPAESDHSTKSDPRTGQGSEGQAVFTVTVKTEDQAEDQPLVQNLLQIRVHSPVQTRDKTPTPNQDQVRHRVQTSLHTQPQDPEEDEHFIKEETSQENEMELDSELVLDYDPLMLLLPDSEDPPDPGDCSLNQDPGTTERTTSEMASSSKTSHYWTDEETGVMLAKLKEFEIIKCLDGRKKRNGNIFKRVSCALAKAGYVRTAEQIRVRWKNVKKAYYDVQRLNQKAGYNRVSYPHMEILEALLSESPTTQAGNGVESDPKTTAAPEPEVDMLLQSGLVSAEEAGDATPTHMKVQRRDTSTPTVSTASAAPCAAPKPTPRKRALSPTSALDSYFERLDNHQKENAQRHRENMKLREKTHRENKTLLLDLVETNKVLVDSMMGMLRQPPPTAPGPHS